MPVGARSAYHVAYLHASYMVHTICPWRLAMCRAVFPVSVSRPFTNASSDLKNNSWNYTHTMNIVLCVMYAMLCTRQYVQCVVCMYQLLDSVQLACPGSSQELSPALRWSPRKHLVEEPEQIHVRHLLQVCWGGGEILLYMYVYIHAFLLGISFQNLVSRGAFKEQLQNEWYNIMCMYGSIVYVISHAMWDGERSITAAIGFSSHATSIPYTLTAYVAVEQVTC